MATPSMAPRDITEACDQHPWIHPTTDDSRHLDQWISDTHPHGISLSTVPERCILHGYDRMLTTWFERGGDPAIRTNKGQTLGHISGRYASASCMQIWIHACQQRRDVQDIIQARDPRGKTVGHAAYDGQSVPGACLWFAAGGDPNCLDDHGLTMMDVVYRNFNTASPEIYVRHINPFCQDAWTTWIIAGGTVLGGAIGNGSYTTFANTIAQSVSSSHPRIAVSRQALRMLAGKQRLTPSFRSAVQTPEGRACALELVPHWRDPLLLASWVSAIPDM